MLFSWQSARGVSHAERFHETVLDTGPTHDDQRVPVRDATEDVILCSDSRSVPDICTFFKEAKNTSDSAGLSQPELLVCSEVLFGVQMRC